MIIGYPVPANPNKLLKGPYPLLEMEILLELGHQVIPIPYNFEQAYQRLIRKCDFIIVHRIFNGDRYAKYGVPYGVIFHGPSKEKMEACKQLDKIDLCKWIGYITEYNKELLIEWGIEKKLIYTPNVVRTDIFNRTKPLGDKIVGGSRWIPAKQFELILQAFPDAWIYGGGVDIEYSNYLFNTFPNAHFTGWIPEHQLKELYEDAYLYIHPSIHKGEGAPKTVMEAMLMELQIITTPKGGTKEFKGVHFLPDNPTVDDILNIYQDVKKVRNIEGREWVLKTHHPKIFIENIIKEIQDTL